MTHQELAIGYLSDKRTPNDLCRNCTGIVENPDMAELVDQDGADSILFCNEYPFDEADEDIFDGR
jgi:hypothetical protein